MRIEVNGLPYILEIRWCPNERLLLAEIVDDGFAFDISRCTVHCLECVRTLVLDYAGVEPDEAELSDAAQILSELQQDLILMEPMTSAGAQSLAS